MHSKKQIWKVPCSNRSSRLLLAGWVIACHFFSLIWSLLKSDTESGLQIAVFDRRVTALCPAPHGVGSGWGGWCAVLRLECAGWFWGDGVSLWSACGVLTGTLEILRWLLPVGHLRLRYRLSSSWASANWSASEVMYFTVSGMFTSFLQVQRPCVQPGQTLCSLMFQANISFSQIMLLKVCHFQILYSISALELFRLSGCYENIKVEQQIENRNITRFILEKVMRLLLEINY